MAVVVSSSSGYCLETIEGILRINASQLLTVDRWWLYYLLLLLLLLLLQELTSSSGRCIVVELEQVMLIDCILELLGQMVLRVRLIENCAIGISCIEGRLVLVAT